jgi:ribonuclease HI
MNKVIEIFTDGSSLGNPGPGGWGTVIIANGKFLGQFGGYESHTTNNRMELMAVIGALKYINEEHKNEEIIIHADSAYVLGGVTSWIANWEKNGWRTANKKEVMNQDLWKELIALIRVFDGKLKWQKVKGHSGHVYNDRADEVATGFASLQQKYIL